MDLDLNPAEDMDVCKCIVSLRHGGTLNNHRAASSLVRLVEGQERCEAADPQGGPLLPQNCNGTELNRIVSCMVLKYMANDIYICVHLTPCQNTNFVGLNL
ncbi:uncharacterized protein TNCV_919431 [Trichonephila clavipes]|nr:uncharacterized protein TNCV_919431 [Trichonephila clavipes]